MALDYSEFLQPPDKAKVACDCGRLSKPFTRCASCGAYVAGYSRRGEPLVEDPSLYPPPDEAQLLRGLRIVYYRRAVDGVSEVPNPDIKTLLDREWIRYDRESFSFWVTEAGALEVIRRMEPGDEP